MSLYFVVNIERFIPAIIISIIPIIDIVTIETKSFFIVYMAGTTKNNNKYQFGVSRSMFWCIESASIEALSINVKKSVNINKIITILPRLVPRASLYILIKL